MTLSGRSTLGAVAMAVGAALHRAGVAAVLTGGACASFYTRGAYQSLDIDFVVVGSATQAAVDRALGSLGFSRKGDRYVHARIHYFIEFPRGPLAIGDDYRIRPVSRRGRAGRALMLSASDACRDRLAAFYHWSDRQSLEVAVAIALAQRVDLAAIRRWSQREGFPHRFEEFASVLRRRRARRRRRMVSFPQ